jgi:hypothetical protein
MDRDSPSAIDRGAQVAEIARMFARLAEERPAVLDALQALLAALVGQSVDPPPTSAYDERRAKDECPPRQASLDAVEAPSAAHRDDAWAAPSGTTSTYSHGSASTPTQAPFPKVAAPQPTEKDRRSLDALMSRFGAPHASVGLGWAGAALLQPARGRWDDDADDARRIARLLRTQARRLRAVRLALHAGAAIPPVDHVLADERIEDWTADPAIFTGFSPHRLREGERWYGLAAKAAAEIRDWLAEHPEAELGGHRTPDALRDRLQCLANAQKGVYCWLEETQGSGDSCAVQRETMATLKRWVARDYFAVYLASGMRLQQRITSAERDETERMLERFDLEHAASDPQGEPFDAQRPSSGCEAALIEPKPEPQRRKARFESVHDAFLAARAEFADELLVFTERAEESAEDSAFRRPDEVHEFFRALSSIARSRRSGARDGTPIERDFLQAGFRSKPSAPSTRKRHHRFYHMGFEGQEVDLSQHVTLGSRNQNTCMSIHWWHDKERGRFVIGHCGKHLPNTMT